MVHNLAAGYEHRVINCAWLGEHPPHWTSCGRTASSSLPTWCLLLDVVTLLWDEASIQVSSNQHTSCLMPVQGPEIRTGFLKNPDQPIKLTAGKEISVTTDYDVKGDDNLISMR